MLHQLLPPALLEDWMRDYYFETETEIDIGSSGVEDYSLSELRALLGISGEDLDRIMFHDSRTLGDPGLRRAIAGRWGDGDASRVIVTHGATEASFLTMNALLERGDEVVVLDPLYQQLYSIAEATGCRLERWPMRFEDGFIPDLDEARRAAHGHGSPAGEHLQARDRPLSGLDPHRSRPRAARGSPSDGAHGRIPVPGEPQRSAHVRRDLGAPARSRLRRQLYPDPDRDPDPAERRAPVRLSRSSFRLHDVSIE